MGRMKLREYARKKRLSLFEVVKKIQKGELRSEAVEENGLSVQYILLDDENDAAASDRSPAHEVEHAHESKDRYAQELEMLRREIARLRRLIESCCDKKRI